MVTTGSWDLGTKIQKEIRKGNQPRSGDRKLFEPQWKGKKKLRSGSAFASDPLQEQHSHRRTRKDDMVHG